MMKLLLSYLASLAILVAGNTLAQEPPDHDFSALEKAIVEETNQARMNPTSYADLMFKR